MIFKHHLRWDHGTTLFKCCTWVEVQIHYVIQFQKAIFDVLLLLGY